MDARHKTQKRTASTEVETPLTEVPPANVSDDHFRNLLDVSARDAYTRPWHRLERGLRLNRLRMYVEDIAPQCSFTKEEKEAFFVYLQRALDKKLLNTLKIVQYAPERQKIESIRGLEVRRMPDGTVKWGFTLKKMKADTTRKRRKGEVVGSSDTAEAAVAALTDIQ